MAKTRPETCVWVMVDGNINLWEGTCKVEWQLNSGTPHHNSMAYCPKCGGKLQVDDGEVKH